jgi:cytochrome c oxidase subunit 2
MLRREPPAPMLSLAPIITHADNGYGRPFDASLDGWRNDALFYTSTVMVLVLFAVMAGVIVWACLVHRAGRHRADYEHGIGRRHLAFTAVIAAIVFFGVDGTLLYDSYVDLQSALWKFPRPDDHPLVVEVLAQQWSWNFRYAGPDGQFGTPDDVVTLDEMHVPLGRPIVVQLRAKDVVHSLWLPNFRVKQDALPGFTTKTWFQAKTTGTFEVGCAQHCGASHYRMRGLITVDEPAAFDAWIASQSQASARRFDERDLEAHWSWQP